MMRHLSRAHALLLVALIARPSSASAQDSAVVHVGQRTRALATVNEALTVAAAGRFDVARQRLEGSLAQCDPGTNGRDCRVLLASGLGSLLQRQAAVDRRNRDTLYTSSISYYDRILRESPSNAEALYGKALAYRALGPHEWMESFYRQAPQLDPERRVLYLTFQGDYYAAANRMPDALVAYRDALQIDTEQEGARAGVVDALAAMGPSHRQELIAYANGWERRYPESASSAYRAVLAASFAPGASRDAIADSAMVGLIRVQATTRATVGAVPSEVSQEWTPVRELREFVKGSGATAAPWWRTNAERAQVLAQSALAVARAAARDGHPDAAERMLIEGVRLVRPSSAVSLDLQRELALLYFRQPELDPDHRKFDALEQQIFEGKMGALAVGDLESAQRYHTTLGLIYAERGAWANPPSPRNAERQLTWALDKADERLARERYYQPLPEIRALLARGLESMGERGEAARRYAEAARAYLDVDDLAAADSATRRASGLGVDMRAVSTVIRLRSELARPHDGTPRECSETAIASIGSAGDRAFATRQQFKVRADCAALAPAAAVAQRRQEIVAFMLVDSAGATLVGGGDVARLERVLRAMLERFGVVARPSHLDRGGPSSPGDASLPVSMPGETVRYNESSALDDIVAARVVAALGESARPFPISVSDGVVALGGATVPPSVVARIRGLRGVREVRPRPSR